MEHDTLTVQDEVTPVLIVGGSLVGLSTALFLSWFGIPVLLVERHAGVSIPRAGGFNARTMELFRMAGVEAAIRQVELSALRGVGALHAESLAGRELGWITDFIFEEGEGSRFSPPPLPVRRSEVGQMLLEPILQTHARAYGADLRFNTELMTFSQDAEGITAVIQSRTSGEEQAVRAGYLIAADGSEGSIRHQLGIAVPGPGTLAHQLAFRFEADSRQAQRGRHIIICYVANPLVRGPLLLLGAQEGMLYTTYHPERGERVEDFLGERGIDLIRAAIGTPDLAVHISSTSSWELRGYVAERFQQGRVFLVGDSAHLMPPSAGLGANTGIADAYNLAWKLALVIQGKADPRLLATYETERRLVAQSTMEQTIALYFTFWADRQPGIGQPIPIQHNLITASGYRYQSAAILSAQGDHEAYEDPRRPTGRPGSHAAHLVLEREDARCSTFDLFGRHFVLLTGQDGAAWCEAAKQINPSWGAVLRWYRIGERCDYLDGEDRFAEAYGVKSSGAVLVRPDGFIAWRAEAMEESPRQVLEAVLLRLLGGGRQKRGP